MPRRQLANPKNTVEVSSRAQWREWLRRHSASSGGIWLAVLKKGIRGHLSPDDVTEEALCFGWIDSVPRSLDARRSMIYVAPRKPKSPWSRLNRARAQRMIAAGKMTAAGSAKISAAKKDGSWDFLLDVQDGVIPPDLRTALRRVPAADTNFAAFPPSSKRIILEWIKSAKTPGTRVKRIAETAHLAGKNVRAHHWRQR